LLLTTVAAPRGDRARFLAFCVLIVSRFEALDFLLIRDSIRIMNGEKEAKLMKTSSSLEQVRAWSKIRPTLANRKPS
jgi:hypothetical protein